MDISEAIHFTSMTRAVGGVESVMSNAIGIEDDRDQNNTGSFFVGNSYYAIPGLGFLHCKNCVAANGRSKGSE